MNSADFSWLLTGADDKPDRVQEARCPIVAQPLYQLEGYSFRRATTWQDKKAAYQLRANVYDAELNWSRSNNGMEADVFDEYSTHFVVTDPNEHVVATLRTLDWNAPWMASECYDNRFADEASLFRTPLTQEVSRLCIAQSHRDRKISHDLGVLDVVFQGVLMVGVQNSKKYSYFVTRAGMERALVRRGFVLPYISPVHKMPDGCRIKSFVVDNDESCRRLMGAERRLYM